MEFLKSSLLLFLICSLALVVGAHVSSDLVDNFVPCAPIEPHDAVVARGRHMERSVAHGLSPVWPVGGDIGDNGKRRHDGVHSVVVLTSCPVDLLHTLPRTKLYGLYVIRKGTGMWLDTSITMHVFGQNISMNKVASVLQNPLTG